MSAETDRESIARLTASMDGLSDKVDKLTADLEARDVVISQLDRNQAVQAEQIKRINWVVWGAVAGLVFHGATVLTAVATWFIVRQ